MRHRWTVWSLIGLVVGVGSGTIGLALAADEPNIWYEIWAPALAAAQQAGKPIYVYIYEYRRVPSGRGAGRDPCEKMGRITLIDRDVKQVMRSYVLCALDVRNPAHHEFIRQHKPNLLPDAEQDPQEATLYRLPVHLFFDSGGRKAFELCGYIAPPTFVDILDTVKLLIAAQSSPDGQLRQARAYARLGHLCLELERYEEGKKNLNRAIELDPENKAGARADAELDLTIMALPDDPGQANRDLASYLTTYPDSKRRVEVRYFMAVSKYVDDDKRAAIGILQDIVRIREPASEQEDRWINYAVLLLYQLQNEEQ